MDAVEREHKAGESGISLSFAHTNGRPPDSDERFVDFVTRAPEKNDKAALSATRKLRQILRPSYLKRLTDIGALTWLGAGLLAAVAAWFAAPDIAALPAGTHAWTPLAMMVLVPALIGAGIYVAPKLAARSRELAPSLDLNLWALIMFGRAKALARKTHPATRADDAPAVQTVAAALRRRISVWTQTSLIWIIIVTWLAWSNFGPGEDGAGNWRDMLSINVNPELTWFSWLRGHWLGEVILTLGVLAAFAMAFWVLAVLYGWLRAPGDRAASKAVRKYPSLQTARKNWWDDLIHLLAALPVSYGFYLVMFNLISPYTTAAQTSFLSACVVFVVTLFLLRDWFYRTLRSYGRALVALDPVPPSKRDEPPPENIDAPVEEMMQNVELPEQAVKA